MTGQPKPSGVHRDPTAWLTIQSATNQSPQANSLLTGKITGNFAESGHPLRFSCLINARIQWVTAEFPAQRNREFSKAYQAILFEEQGKSSQTTARPPNCDPMPCVIAPIRQANMSALPPIATARKRRAVWRSVRRRDGGEPTPARWAYENVGWRQPADRQRHVRRR
jgi:hypothetical protein